MKDLYEILLEKKVRRIVKDGRKYKIVGVTDYHIELERLNCKSHICVLIPRFYERLKINNVKIKTRYEVLKYEI